MRKSILMVSTVFLTGNAHADACVWVGKSRFCQKVPPLAETFIGPDGKNDPNVETWIVPEEKMPMVRDLAASVKKSGELK